MRYGLLDLIGNIRVVVLMIAYLMLQLNKLSSSTTNTSVPHSL